MSATIIILPVVRLERCPLDPDIFLPVDPRPRKQREPVGAAAPCEVVPFCRDRGERPR